MQLTQLFNNIASAIQKRSGSASSMKASEFPQRISEIPYCEPEIPFIGEEEEVIYFFLYVLKNSPNDIAFRVTGAYVVDWGDGSTESFSSGATASKVYSGEERYVTIKVTPVNRINTLEWVKHSLRPTSSNHFACYNIIGVVIQAPLLSEWYNSASNVRFYQLRKFEFRKASAVTSMATQFTGTNSLTSMKLYTDGTIDLSVRWSINEHWGVSEAVLDYTNVSSYAAAATNFANLRSLRKLRIFNMHPLVNSIAFNNTQMDVDGIVEVFNDLRDRTSESVGTINIQNSYGASRLSSQQRAIAQNKNWTITG